MTVSDELIRLSISRNLPILPNALMRGNATPLISGTSKDVICIKDRECRPGQYVRPSSLNLHYTSSTVQ